MRFSHEICLFLKVVDIIYALSRQTHSYYYGDVAKIYAFFAQDLSILRSFDIIYAFSHQICLFLRVVDIIYALSKHTHS